MLYWIQRADFTSSEQEADNAEAIRRIFQSHPWRKELEFQATREQHGEETCDPGLGIVLGDGRILHLCPIADGVVRCHYHFSESRRVAGFIRTTRPQVVTFEIDSHQKAEEVIHRFLASDHEYLKAQAAYGKT